MSSEAYDSGPFGVIRYGRDEMVQHEHELADGATVEPGMLLERVDEGGDIKVQPHSTEGEASDYVAIEARGRGMNALDGEYDGYDEYVRYVKVSGGGLNARLAAGEDAGISDGLTSNGDGYLKVEAGDGSEEAALEAASAVDNSAGADAVFIPTEA